VSSPGKWPRVPTAQMQGGRNGWRQNEILPPAGGYRLPIMASAHPYFWEEFLVSENVYGFIQLL